MVNILSQSEFSIRLCILNTVFTTWKRRALEDKDLLQDFPINRMFAGSAYFIFSKEAVDFILEDEKVKTLFEWSKDTLTPGILFCRLSKFYRKLK